MPLRHYVDFSAVFTRHDSFAPSRRQDADDYFIFRDADMPRH